MDIETKNIKMHNSEIQHFTIRIYAIIINYADELLLSDEFQLDTKMTKFPGGGLEFGEGPIDCLKREAIEEFGQEIDITGHFYTTDFFQKALFLDGYQVISIYYLAKFKDSIRFKISSKPFDFEEFRNGNQSFRWQKIKELNPHDFYLPIDKYVANILLKKYVENEV